MKDPKESLKKMAGPRSKWLSYGLLMALLVTASTASADLLANWAARYNGPAKHLDVPTAITVDERGNTYVTGYSLGMDTGFDYATVKYDSNGEEAWTVRFNGPANGLDIATGIAVDRWGNVYVTGYSYGSDNGLEYYDYATIKYNAWGNERWTAYFDGPSQGMDVATAITADGWGNVYVTGYCCDEDAGSDHCDFVTVKYNIWGREQWSAYYDGPTGGRDVPTSISLDENGHVYVSGYSFRADTDEDTCDYSIVKYDSRGREQDVQVQDDPPIWDESASVSVMDKLGNLYTTGPSGEYTARGRDYATNKRGMTSGSAGAAMGLILRTKYLDLPDIAKFDLVKTLEAGLRSLVRGGDRRAAIQLQAFIEAIETKRGKTLTSEQADSLMDEAKEIVDEIGEREERRASFWRRLRSRFEDP